MKITFKKYELKFSRPILTSRGGMNVKNGYFVYLEEAGKVGVGECSFIEGLSCDNLENYEEKLEEIAAAPQSYIANLESLQSEFPSIRFGIETALLSLKSSDDILFQSDFAFGKCGIPINGLVWMGKEDFLQQQIEEKLAAGFRCIKLKVGALDFSTELKLIEGIRKQFSAKEIELRLDANGAFKAQDVFEKLKAFSAFEIHSIEQPVQPKQFNLMREICASNIIPVALDEELIGVNAQKERAKVLDAILPTYIILKPSLLGGLQPCNEWISLAEKRAIKWWATSALESNIGLNAIAQWVAEKENLLPQGLGTGSLYQNNVPSKLEIRNGALWNCV